MSVMRTRRKPRGRRGRTLTAVACIVALMGVSAALAGCGPKGSAGKPAASAGPVEEVTEKCAASGSVITGDLTLEAKLALVGTAKKPKLQIELKKPMYDPRDLGTTERPAHKVTLTSGIVKFPDREYRPDGKRSVTFSLDGGVGVVPLGGDAAKWDRGTVIPVVIGGVLKDKEETGGRKVEATCKASFKLGDFIRRTLDCVSKSGDVLYRVVEKLTKSKRGWYYSIETIEYGTTKQNIGEMHEVFGHGDTRPVLERTAYRMPDPGVQRRLRLRSTRKLTCLTDWETAPD